MIFINFSALIAFAFDAQDDGPDKIGYLVTLLLTAVAFQFAILDTLPKVSYSTFVDYYVQFSFSFIFLLLIEASLAMVDILGDNNLQLFWAFTILFIVSHIGFGYSAFKRRKYELGKLNQNASQMKDYSKRKRTSARILGVHKHTGHQKSVTRLMGL